jgi:hypothetical protein
VVVAVLIYFEETTIAPALSTNASLARFAELLVPAAVSFLRVSSPFIIFAIVALESYELADKRFFHTFSRLFATRMFYVLVILFQTMFMQVSGVPGDADYVCPETQVGVFYYSLVFLDIIIDAGLSIVAPWVKMKARKCLGRGVAGEFDSHYKGLDQYKDEFPIPVNIINIMYQQGLIWSGMPYCPALPVLGSLSLFLTIIVKRLQVINLCRPPVKPMGVARQQSYFRSLLIVTLVIAMIPFSFFMRTTATCGPYFAADVYIADDSTTWTTPVDRLWEEIEKLPAWVVMVFNYLQNVVVLWVVLIVLVIYTLYLRKTMVAVRGELHYAQDRVKLEQKDLQEIIKKEKIILDETQEKGRTQFQHWMLGEDMVHFSDRYRILFQTNYFDDIFELSKLTDHELRELISEWRGPHGEAILPGHLSFFIRKLGEKRLDLVT